MAATILRFVDARLTMALGFALVGCACFMAGQLTHEWIGEDFLPSQLVQAVGQSFGLTSVVWFALKHLRPTEIFTFGALLQTGRLFGAQLGAAFVQTFLRIREQTYSNLIGLHVNAGSLLTDQRLDEYAGARGRWPFRRAARSCGASHGTARALRSESGVRARLYRWLHGSRLCRHWGSVAYVAAARSTFGLEQPAARR